MKDAGDTIRELELRLLTTSARADAAFLLSVLTDDFQELGSSGRIYSKNQIIRALESEPPVQISVQDFRTSPLSNTVVLVTYRAIKEQGDSPAVESLRSSIWLLQDGRWRIRFHQGSIVS